MTSAVQRFPLADLAGPAAMILVLGFLIGLWVTRKPHWSLFVAVVKAGVFLLYYGVFFDGKFTFLDDWSYLERGQYLLAQGVSVTNLLAHLPELFSVAGGTHFVYYLYNADSFRLLGDGYYAPVALNIVLTFFAAGAMAAAARSGLGFSRPLAVGLFVFLAVHPDITAWSTIMNGKDTLVLTGTALAVFVISLAERGCYGRSVLLAVGVGLVLFFTRFYVPLILLAAFLGTMLLSQSGRRRYTLWLLVPIGLVWVVSVLGWAGLQEAHGRLMAGFVNPLYGLLRMMLTPIPFHTTDHYAFLDLPQVFHWAMMPAMFYGIVRIWRRATLTARFMVVYFVLLILLYAMFDDLQGPRHRYQLDVIIALFQFYGALGLLRQFLPGRRGAMARRTAAGVSAP